MNSGAYLPSEFPAVDLRPKFSDGFIIEVELGTTEDVLDDELSKRQFKLECHGVSI